VNPSDYVGIMLYYTRTFEPQCLNLLRKTLQKGDVVVDVGANIGIFSVECAAYVGTQGRVVAIEPAPPNQTQLRHNLALNHLEHVTVIDGAAGEGEGSVRLMRPSGSNCGMFTVGDVSGEESYSVRLRTLDSILAELHIDCVDAIKLDIEGAELAALRGGTQTIVKSRPLVLIELDEPSANQCGVSTVDVIRYLNELGYDGWIMPRRGRPRPLSPGSCTGCESVFIHKDRHDLRTRLGLSGARRRVGRFGPTRVEAAVGA
jgi:FkbM family methyltransferase